MRIALVQIDPVVGDFAGNSDKICSAVERARREGCRLVVFPELALVGYPPRDLLDKHGFVEACRACWPRIERASEGVAVLVGTVARNEGSRGKPYHNSALLCVDGRLQEIAHKRLLPSYDVFDEERYFEPGAESLCFTLDGRRIGVTICEDIWNVGDFLPRPLYPCDPMEDLSVAGVDLVVNLSASPYHVGKADWVSDLLRSHALRRRFPVVYVNQVGGNDELIFQGRSMVWDASGRLVAAGADFEEDLVVYDLEDKSGECHHHQRWQKPAEICRALQLGLRDYAQKCGFSSVVLGLSGGIDSAVTACLAVLALGRGSVMAAAMPGPYNAPESLDDACELADRLGILLKVIPITELFETALNQLAPVFSGLAPDVTEENMQARLRGLILMALSNKFNRLLLNTGNKSELAVGYCTLYGDMNGGLSVLGDVPKTMVYAIAAHLNREYGWIPKRIIERPPSAELRPDQKDEDSLPPYPVLDRILAAYIEKRQSAAEIIAHGFDPTVVRWVIRRVDRNEYKRWQAPPVLRVTTKAFGIGRRFPIAQKYQDE